MFHDGTRLLFTKSRGKKFLYSTDREMGTIDSLSIGDYILDGINFKDKIYAIYSDKERTYFGSLDSQKQNNIKLHIVPHHLIQSGKDDILIAGNSKEGDAVVIALYSPVSNKSKIIKEFKDYTIISGLQANKKVIAGFIGNIVGSVTKYKLFYSLDNGNSWKIKKLAEESYILPRSLINNTLMGQLLYKWDLTKC